MKQILASELILNPDGSIYHLHLQPEQIADTILLVGDQNRVEQISKHFDKIEVKVQNREFVTHTGIYKNRRITAISTGIGTDNIDIVINELDALVNIDFKTRQVRENLKLLNLIRIGTSGALQKEIPVGAFVLSKYGLGFDGLIYFYKNARDIIEKEITNEFCLHSLWDIKLSAPYVVKSSDKLCQILGEGLIQGITATAPGFYAPQGRELRLNIEYPRLNDMISAFSYEQYKIINFEMETSALYGLAKMLGHHACTVCVIIANRITKQFAEDYHSKMDKLITLVLDRIILFQHY